MVRSVRAVLLACLWVARQREVCVPAEGYHLEVLGQGVAAWNKWRALHPRVRPILREANLRGGEFDDINLEGANLIRADLRGASLNRARLQRAQLYDANLNHAQLDRANLRGARLIGGDLSGSSLVRADLAGANLSWANLSEANLAQADLTGCRIYAISAWDVKLEGAIQRGLIITRQLDNDSRRWNRGVESDAEPEPLITVDYLEVAQFIYLLINNHNLRHVIETINSKVVLILGRFTAERKPILDALRDELRTFDLMPVIFDFEKPATRDLTGTISILAHLACFILVDLTAPRSAPHELASLVPHCVVPIKPILRAPSKAATVAFGDESEYAMFDDLRRRYHWVLPTFTYRDKSHLLKSVERQVIKPALLKASQLTSGVPLRSWPG
jgi:hypothetical protein